MEVRGGPRDGHGTAAAACHQRAQGSCSPLLRKRKPAGGLLDKVHEVVPHTCHHGIMRGRLIPESCADAQIVTQMPPEEYAHVVKRLAQDLQDVPAALRQRIEKQHAVGRPRDLAWQRHLAAPDQPHSRDRPAGGPSHPPEALWAGRAPPCCRGTFARGGLNR